MSENKNHPLQKISKSNQSTWLSKLENATGKLEKGRDLKKRVIYFLMDCSGSMDDDSKFQNAKKGAIDYAQEAVNKGYRIGLISFGSSGNMILPAQTFIDEFKSKVLSLQIDGSTNLTQAINIARLSLSENVGERVMFIVTDGYPDDVNTAKEEAKIASKTGIEIMTLGTDDADIEFLRTISTKKEFSAKVDKRDLQKGILNMAKLLPNKN